LIKSYQIDKYIFKNTHYRFDNFFIAYLKSCCRVLKSRTNISFFATNMYCPDVKVCSYCKLNDRRSRFALFLYTAFPTFLEATKAIFRFLFGIKKTTNDLVCHRLSLLYILENSFEEFIL
jgi:hypothetical protein